MTAALGPASRMHDVDERPASKRCGCSMHARAPSRSGGPTPCAGSRARTPPPRVPCRAFAWSPPGCSRRRSNAATAARPASSRATSHDLLQVPFESLTPAWCAKNRRVMRSSYRRMQRAPEPACRSAPPRPGRWWGWPGGRPWLRADPVRPRCPGTPRRAFPSACPPPLAMPTAVALRGQSAGPSARPTVAFLPQLSTGFGGRPWGGRRLPHTHCRRHARHPSEAPRDPAQRHAVCATPLAEPTTALGAPRDATPASQGALGRVAGAP